MKTRSLPGILIFLIAWSLSHADRCPLEGSFAPSDGSRSPELVWLGEAGRSDDTVRLEVVIGGPTTSSDIYAFSFDIVLADPTIVEFVAGSEVLGPALEKDSCASITTIVRQNGARVTAGVSKLGQCAGNAIAATDSVVVSLTFLLMEAGSTTLSFTPGSSAIDSAGESIAAIRFDSAKSVLSGACNVPAQAASRDVSNRQEPEKIRR